MFLECGHARHTDPARKLPKRFPGLVIGHTHPSKKLRRLGEHPVGNGRSRLTRQSVAHRAVVSIYLCAGQKIRLVGGDLRVRMGQFVQVGVLRHRGQFPFEWHLGCARRHRGMATGEIRISPYKHQQNSHQDPQDDSFEHCFLYPASSISRGRKLHICWSLVYDVSALSAPPF